MVRTEFYISPKLKKQLEREARSLEITYSEYVRRILDERKPRGRTVQREP